jgi:hypothetical protein
VTNDFLNPEKLVEVQQAGGLAVLDALIGYDFGDAELHPEAGAVWEL